MSLLLVTGANGFIGRALCDTLVADGAAVRAAVRAPVPTMGETAVVGEVGPDTQWAEALRGVDAVVHLAARVHVLRETVADPLAAFRRVNVAGTERLARACAESGIRRLVYVSSIKVNGEATHDHPFTETDPPAPEDAYGRSKLEAEQVLHRIVGETGLQAVVVRPCLVYGPGVGGNILRLLRAIQRGLPLPLGSVRNRRSVMGVDNLCDLLLRCVRHPAAAGQTFLASEGRDLSTPELVRGLAAGLGKSARLIPVPVRLLELAARVGGRTDAYERLCGSLQVDSGKARRQLEWVPPTAPEEGLRRTGSWYAGQVR